MTSVIGLNVNTLDAIQRQQQMQQQYGGAITQPDGNGQYLDTNLGRGGLF
ncbi:MAG: hypothetical protein MO846_06495 [Candidatus Devosia symbiotica]|nr:hypothetical protein [Candidatus Devosia symbiotica]